MNTHNRIVKLNKLRILLDSGCSYSNIMVNMNFRRRKKNTLIQSGRQKPEIPQLFKKVMIFLPT